MPNTPSLDQQVEPLALLNALVEAIGYTQAVVASSCAEGHDLTPPPELITAIDCLWNSIAALLEDREGLKAELRSIDAVLARRPALANCTTRTDSIELCIATAREVDGLRAGSSLPSRSE